ncbi:MAG: hypothetical protein AAFU41_16825 [Pseudomonadota bacterium]
MTLEKLLIFGFAIAAVGALALTGSGIMTERKTDRTGYKTDVQELVNKSK